MATITPQHIKDALGDEYDPEATYKLREKLNHTNSNMNLAGFRHIRDLCFHGSDRVMELFTNAPPPAPKQVEAPPTPTTEETTDERSAE